MQTISPSLVLLRCIHKNLQEFSRTDYCSDILCIKMACADIEDGIIRLERYDALTSSLVTGDTLEHDRIDRNTELKTVTGLKDVFPRRMLDVAKRGLAAPETLTHREVSQMAFVLEACLTLQVD